MILKLVKIAIILVSTTYLANNVATASPTNEKVQWSSNLLVGNGYHVRWNNKDPEYLVMEISAPVRGYVSIGFSPNGAMRGSDIVMGWVDASTGQAYIKDLHGVGNIAPVEDTDSDDDYELLWAEENEFGTTVRFRRKWDTCDKQHDFEITEDTVRLIWAVSDEDPIKNEKFLPSYHGVNFRGGRSVHLKIPPIIPGGFPDDQPVPDPSIHYWDVRMSNAPVSGETDTTYHCKIFKAPKFTNDGRKHQIIGYRTLIDQENVQWVHHFNFFECYVPPHVGGSAGIFEDVLDHPGEACYTRNMPPEWGQYCITVPFVWVVGADGLMLPEHGGIPLHEEHNGTTYFMLEVHYDNPKKIQFIDNSGLRVFITDRPRENDYGTITVHHRFGQFQMIPPKANNFRSMAYCTSECTKSVLPPEGITVTHSVLHAHLTAKKLMIRHIRDGVELPPIAQDLHYDFNFQQSRVVHPPKKILPGDIVMMECEYDTSDRENITYGGTSTRDEMCQGYITYYPKVPLAACKTQPEFYNFFDALGIRHVEGKQVLNMLQLPYVPKPNQLFDPGDDAYILKNGTNGKIQHAFDLLYVTPYEQNQNAHYHPTTVREYVNSLDWSGRNGELIKKVWKQWWDGEQLTFCTAPGFQKIPLENYLVKYPEYKPYQKPISSNCRLYSSAANGLASQIEIVFLFVATTAALIFSMKTV